MKRTVAEAVVNFLSFSGKTSAHVGELAGFRDREWKQGVSWLHDAGLALYLLQKLRQATVADIIPKATLSRLEENLAANRRRVIYMASQFEFLNQKLSAAGVRYASREGVFVGPSVLPRCVSTAPERLRLPDRSSVTATGTTVLEEAGYFLSKHKANEFVFLMPSREIPPLTMNSTERACSSRGRIACCLLGQ